MGCCAQYLPLCGPSLEDPSTNRPSNTVTKYVAHKERLILVCCFRSFSAWSAGPVPLPVVAWHIIMEHMVEKRDDSQNVTDRTFKDIFLSPQLHSTRPHLLKVLPPPICTIDWGRSLQIVLLGTSKI